MILEPSEQKKTFFELVSSVSSVSPVSDLSHIRIVATIVTFGMWEINTDFTHTCPKSQLLRNCCIIKLLQYYIQELMNVKKWLWGMYNCDGKECRIQHLTKLFFSHQEISEIEKQLTINSCTIDVAGENRSWPIHRVSSFAPISSQAFGLRVPVPAIQHFKCYMKMNLFTIF